MESKPINVFLLDDEFPKPDDLRQKGVFNTAISTEDLYHIAVNCTWDDLYFLQQLIKDIVTSDPCKEGHINLIGYSSPTQALLDVAKGLTPNVIIYDWEYLNAPAYNTNAKDWLLELFQRTEAFIFIYSKKSNELTRLFNGNEFVPYSDRFQLFLKGNKRQASFSSEEFIFQHIISAASKTGKININGVSIDFRSNPYLSSASDILYLQRILGSQYVLDHLKEIGFFIDTASVEKLLNDSGGYVYHNVEKRILISPDEVDDEEKLQAYEKITYLEVVKRFSLPQLEDTLERGVLFI